MTTENIEIDALTINGRMNEEDIVTPWDVESKNETGIDYDKLISELYKDYSSQKNIFLFRT